MNCLEKNLKLLLFVQKDFIGLIRSNLVPLFWKNRKNQTRILIFSSLVFLILRDQFFLPQVQADLASFQSPLRDKAKYPYDQPPLVLAHLETG